MLPRGAVHRGLVLDPHAGGNRRVIELKTLYRGSDNESGLEVLLVLAFVNELGQVNFVGTDEDGQVISKHYSDVKLNWRYDREKRDWIDIDLPIDE
jgi:hypothetical protein